MSRLVVTVLALTFASCSTRLCEAHAFGARYDLPLPLWLYLTAAGAAVALSFLVATSIVKAEPPKTRRWRVDLHGSRAARAFGRFLIPPLQTLSLVFFALVLATGFLGVESTTKNFAPAFVWVIWWVGLAFVQALAGDLWRLVNPWSLVFRGLRRAPRTPGLWAYPKSLGAWPGVMLFLVFAWLELVSSSGERPVFLAGYVVAYSALTWGAMWLWGREPWLRNGEAFNIAFGLFARFSPASCREVHDETRCELRPYGVGLLSHHPVSWSVLSFVVCMLATVTFDGILETPFWLGLVDWLVSNPGLRPALLWFRGHGVDLLQLFKTLGLLALPCVFFFVYMLFSNLVARAGGSEEVGRVARHFVLSLIPIAIAYHLAHYLSYLLLAGQLIIPALSDPFGFGWDLFGTANYVLDVGVINTKTVWYLAVIAIVVGHVFAVYLAHRTALQVFGSARRALLSQIPMLVLMVGYTMLSLWILSQPIVEA